MRFLRGVPVRRRLCSGCKLSGYRGFMYLKCFVEAIRCPELFLGLCLILCLRSRRVVHCAGPRQLLLLQRPQLHRWLRIRLQLSRVLPCVWGGSASQMRMWFGYRLQGCLYTAMIDFGFGELAICQCSVVFCDFQPGWIHLLLH